MRSNPLRDYLDDAMFAQLWEKGFLNERAIRDFYIRATFSERKDRQKPKDIIAQLQEEFPYLSVETVRKIVYSRDQAFEIANY
ncbi:MAG: hypothetical protein ACRBF0_09540 [Calditrichia bacterium]